MKRLGIAALCAIVVALLIPASGHADVARDAWHIAPPPISHVDCVCGQQVSLITAVSTDFVKITGENQYDYKVSQWVFTPDYLGSNNDANFTNDYGWIWHGWVRVDAYWRSVWDKHYEATGWCYVPPWPSGYARGRYTFVNCYVPS